MRKFLQVLRRATAHFLQLAPAIPLSYYRGVTFTTAIFGGRNLSERNFSPVAIFYICLLTLLGTLRATLAPDATVLIVATATFFLCCAVVTDIRSQIIANELNLAFFICSFVAVNAVALARGDLPSAMRACAASALLFGIFWLLHAVSKQGLGGGDVKLAPSLGLILGFVSWQAVLSAILIAFLLNGLAALIVIATKLLAKQLNRQSSQQPRTLPFAPTLACGTLLALLV